MRNRLLERQVAERTGELAAVNAIAAAIDEAIKCREEGTKRTILFNLCGHGMLDLASYDQVRTLLAPSRDLLSVLVRTGNMENYVSIEPRHGGIEN